LPRIIEGTLALVNFGFFDKSNEMLLADKNFNEKFDELPLAPSLLERTNERRWTVFAF
jgi:hypothetical protein